MADLQNTTKIIPNSPLIGMNSDMIISQMKDGQVTYALNAVIENFDGNEVNYQNEGGNDFCIKFPEGYKVIGRHLIPEQNKVVYFMANPQTNKSEIGYKLANTCEYVKILNADCLNFNINYPILKIEQKTTDCSTQLYWTDNYNDRRWIDLDDLPYNQIPDPNKEGFFINLDTVDCNKLLVQPNFSIPKIVPTSVEVGGNLTSGSYQFAIEYSNSIGEAYTSMYAFTNPMGIFDKDKVTQSFDLPTSQAIQLDITNIDTTGLYDYFNLVVIKTVNNIPTPYRAGTFAIIGDTYQTTYTGDDPSEVRLSYQDVFDRFPYYDLAEDVTSSDDTLVWSGLRTTQKKVYQEIWSNVILQWESYKIPVNKFEAYNNPINTSEYRGYMRDEVYCYYGCFILRNGKITEKFPIPGRMANQFDLDIISNDDAINFKNDPCTDPDSVPRWKVYNTATVIDTTEEYKNFGNTECYKGSYQYGDFGYYESTDKYPNNVEIWGTLAGQPIRLPKFPDCLISPIHSTEGTQEFIYPIGVRIDANSLYNAIKNSSLTDLEKNDIVDFKIIRANRATQKSIIAKGMLFNVGKYNTDSTTTYYPNYPYNDLRADPFLADRKIKYKSGANVDYRLKGFDTEDSKSRYNFYSPDTLFYQPFGIDTGYLKLETVEYGKSKGHFVQIDDAARYQFMSPKALLAAFGVAMSSGVSLDSGGGFLGVAPSATLNPSNIPPGFLAMLDIIRGIIPFLNYSWMYTSVGDYNQSIGVPNEGNKLRQITSGSYLISGFQTVDGERINNFRRESSVYLKTNGTLPYVHEQYNTVPEDTSRYTLSNGVVPTEFNYTPYEEATGVYWDSLTPATRQGLFFYRDASVYTNLDNYNEALSDLGVWSRSWAAMTVPVTEASYNIIEGIRENAIRQYVTSILNIDISGVGADCLNPNKLTYTDISSYYGAIKRVFNDQYGKIYSTETIDTGFTHALIDKTNTTTGRFNEFPTIFGGDIFINKFALKRKHSFFLDNTINKPNGADIALNLLGNVAYPIYFYSTDQIDATFNTDVIDQKIGLLVDFSFGNVVGNIVSGGTKPVVAGLTIMASIFKGYVDVLGVPNVNLDCYQEKNLNIEGKAYLFSYGIPYFYAESEVNVDFRQAYNAKEGDFYPHVGTDIPDSWLQEKNVSIVNDNSYIYNKSYSKQNKETYFPSLRDDFDPNKLCTVNYPNRAIYSQKANLEETKNNWLVYRPISYKEFPKTYGKLISLDGLESRAILARFENKSQLYNVLSTISTTKETAYLGNPTFFSEAPIDFAETNNGYAGAQHKFLLKTEYGHLMIDSERGQIFLLQGRQVKNISDTGMSKFFGENLPFNIRYYFPNANIDNHFKDVGLTGVYDSRGNRFLITKKDYIPLNTEIIYNSDIREFTLNGKVVSVFDTTLFCNKSWTISYNLTTQSWISFHSYVPEFYNSYPAYFETTVDSQVYSHTLSTKFNRFYGKIEDYILEYPLRLAPDEEILSNFQDYTTVLKYTNTNIFYEVEDGVYFNKAIIYNNFQNSGVRNLIQKPKNNLAAYRKYPKFNTNSIDILYTKSDSLFKFNTFWDIVVDKTKPCFNTPCNIVSLDKQLDDTNLDYSIRSHQKTRLRSREARIRLIYNQSDDYKLISKFLLTVTQKSIK